MKFAGWNDDDVYGPDDDSYSRTYHQKLYLRKMREWCRPGRAIRVHFPNPKHNSYWLHGVICTLVRPERWHDDDVWVAAPSGDYERFKILHTLEFRPVDPLTALACAAREDDRGECEKPTESGEGGKRQEHASPPVDLKVDP